jgi:mediator of RNA polymerase II transcription subunit 10
MDTSGSGNGMVISQTNDMDDPKQNLKQVIHSIQKALVLLHHLYLTVSSFNAASQLPLLHRLYFSYVLSYLLQLLVTSENEHWSR